MKQLKCPKCNEISSPSDWILPTCLTIMDNGIDMSCDHDDFAECPNCSSECELNDIEIVEIAIFGGLTSVIGLV